MYNKPHYERLERKMNNDTADEAMYKMEQRVIELNNQYRTFGISTPNEFQLGSSPLKAITTAKMPKLTRLTTSGDWTISLNENNKLVAFNSTGTTIVATGSLLSADGRAWMWNGSKLWSGVLGRVEGEAEARQREKDEENMKKAEREKKILENYYAKRMKLINKLDVQKTNELKKLG
jgi:hypothetical protein